MRTSKMLVVSLAVGALVCGPLLATDDTVVEQERVTAALPEVDTSAESPTAVADDRVAGPPEAADDEPVACNGAGSGLGEEERYALALEQGLIWSPDHATPTGGGSCPATYKCANRPYCFPVDCYFVDTGMTHCGGIGGISCSDHSHTIHIKRCARCSDLNPEPQHICAEIPIDVDLVCM